MGEKYKNLDDAMRAALTLPDAAALQVTAAPLALSGDQRLRDVRFLARGGMGSVYRAHDVSLGHEVAIKLVRPGRWDPELGERLKREAATLARLSHPSIVRFFRTEEREGHLLIVMELVEGEPLRRIVRKRLPLSTMHALMLACGEALCAAHAAGFAHRDFKPDNVLVRKDLTPCVLDFGLARALGSPLPEFRTLTQKGQIMGTATYMAPEQGRGERGDALSDQYSFGLATWEALHGALPSSHATQARGATGTLPSARAVEPRSVPSELSRVLERMLAERPSDRFPSLAEGLSALRAVSLPE